MKIKQFFARNGVLIGSLVVAAAILYTAITGILPVGVVATGSMAPNMPVGTVVVFGPADNIKPTDIIAFHNPDMGGHITTHTFIGYDKDGNVMTKGDANPTPDVFDRPLTKADITGKVILKIVPFWTSLKGIGIVMLLLLGAVIIFLATRMKDDVPTDKSQEEELAPTPV